MDNPPYFTLCFETSCKSSPGLSKWTSRRNIDEATNLGRGWSWCVWNVKSAQHASASWCVQTRPENHRLNVNLLSEYQTSPATWFVRLDVILRSWFYCRNIKRALQRDVYVSTWSYCRDFTAWNVGVSPSREMIRNDQEWSQWRQRGNVGTMKTKREWSGISSAFHRASRKKSILFESG